MPTEPGEGLGPPPSSPHSASLTTPHWCSWQISCRWGSFNEPSWLCGVATGWHDLRLCRLLSPSRWIVGLLVNH